jgi:hypothetical protein
LFGRHVDTLAGNVELPAVIDAAEPTFLVATEIQMGATMRTVGIQYSEFSLGIAEGHEVLSQETQPNGRSVVLANFLFRECRYPEPS